MIGAAHAATREDFDQGRDFRGGVHEFRRSEDAGNGQLAASLGGPKNGNRQARAHQKFRAGVQASRGIVFGQDRSRADQYRLAIVLDDLPNHVGSIWHGHRDFHNWNASSTDGPYGSPGLVAGTGSHQPDDANLTHLSYSLFHRH